jgi:hypothetical protein
MDYRMLQAIAALNEKYAAGEIPREEYDRLHIALATDPRRARRNKELEVLAAGIVTAVRQHVEAKVADSERRSAEKLAALEQRLAVLEHQVEQKGTPEAGGLRRVV